MRGRTGLMLRMKSTPKLDSMDKQVRQQAAESLQPLAIGRSEKPTLTTCICKLLSFLAETRHDSGIPYTSTNPRQARVRTHERRRDVQDLCISAFGNSA